MISAETLAAFDAEVEARLDARDIVAALKYLPPEAEITNDERLRASQSEMRKVGFSTSQKSQEALCLYIRASRDVKGRDASGILLKAEQGPTIWPWHLKKFLEESAP